MTVVGFDFGTTNSLISFVNDDESIDLLVDNKSIPSVVKYEGSKVIVGRDARDSLESAGLGIKANIVTSPKTILGDEPVDVGGVKRDTIDIVGDVIKHVKEASLATARGRELGDFDSVVATIPIDMDGRRRAALREAFNQCGLTVVQFVHEPFAALYGYFRSSPSEEFRAFDRQYILVVDWGGGTLDVTLCQLVNGRLLQLKNSGTEDAGGDHFDQALRNRVLQDAVTTDAEIHPDARRRLLHECESKKIELSGSDSSILYVRHFYPESGEPLVHNLTRADLDRIAEPIIRRGMTLIEGVLESAQIGEAQISMCLVTGGMSAMPAIKGRLQERFGPDRVRVPKRSSTLIAQGAAWIAHDERRLELAKNLELELARGSHLSLVDAGTPMPFDRHDYVETFQLYCADPRDGVAKFQLAAPKRFSSHVQQADPRDPLGMVAVRVDSRAEPFREGLTLDIKIDSDMIVHATAGSSNIQDTASTQIHNLEFGITLGSSSPDSDFDSDGLDASDGDKPRHQRGDLVVRPNVADRVDDALVPGELLYKYKSSYFDVRKRPPQVQVEEHLYYRPCAVCGAKANDPSCRCASTPEPVKKG